MEGYATGSALRPGFGSGTVAFVSVFALGIATVLVRLKPGSGLGPAVVGY